MGVEFVDSIKSKVFVCMKLNQIKSITMNNMFIVTFWLKFIHVQVINIVIGSAITIIRGISLHGLIQS